MTGFGVGVLLLFYSLVQECFGAAGEVLPSLNDNIIANHLCQKSPTRNLPMHGAGHEPSCSTREVGEAEGFHQK